MRTSNFAKFVAKHHRDDEIRARRERRRQAGVTALLLFFMLVLTASPVSASESPSRLLDTVPFAFTKTSPMDDQVNQAVNLTLTWEISKFTDEYFYCIDATLNSSCNDSWHSTGLNTYQNLASLAYNTTYEWQVYAFNELGTTYANTDTWWQFTTAEAAPGAFGKISPSDDVTNQEISLTLSWNSSSGADSYEYCYDNTLDNSCAGSWTSAGASTSADISSLAYGTQYEWQVRAINTNPMMTYADGGEWWHFTTRIPPPGAFSKSNPSSGAISQLINLTLSWGASSYSTSYEYCYDSNLEIDHVGVCDGIWTNTVLTYANIINLEYETQYEWQVRAINDSGITYANTGTWWTFTTKANPTGLYKISPGDLTSNHPVSLALEWSSYGGTTSYEYCVDPTSSGTLDFCDSGWTNNAMNTIVTVDLAYGIEYEWQIRANDSEVTYADSGDWWIFTTVEAKPGAFFKTTPEDGTIGPLLSLTLEWTASSGATSYRYCIDDTLDTICSTSWESVTTNSADIAGLSFNTIYEWQVRAYNNNPSYTSADSGAWHQFTTVVAQPGNFLKTSPSDGDIDQPVSPTLSWGTSGGATSYEYCIDSNLEVDHIGVCDASWISTGIVTSASLSGLTNNTVYEWQVRAKNANPNPTYANSNTWWTFTTIAAPPGAFSKVGPLHGASDLLPSSVTIQWTPSAGAASYWYCVDTTVNSSCDGSWIYAGTGTSVLLTDLIFNTTYQWQMRAVNANPSMTYADGNVWWTFSTRVGTPPSAFPKIYPLDISIDVPTNPTLQWGASTYASHYEYCIDSDRSLGHVGVCDGTWISTLSSTQVSLSGLALNTLYEWQVRAWNDTVGPTYSNSGSYWTFTTVTIDPPTAFGKTTPVSGSTGLLPPSLTLSWEPSTNVDVYEYCYDDNVDGSCGSVWTSTANTSEVISDLDFNKRYEWQVRAFRDGNPNPTLANGGIWWTFRTVVAQPGGFNKSEPINAAIDRPVALTLIWGASTGVTSYEYCVEVYDGNSTCEGSWLEPFPVTNNSATISGLEYATTYSWQVRAINANPVITYANTGTWYQFTTIVAPPGGFNKTSPVNGSTQPLTVSLSWETSSGATSYAYCYDSLVDSSCTGAWVATTATSATLSGLTYGTGYEWQVRATNLSGTVYANGGTLWSFSTVANPPGSFPKLSPTKGQTGQLIDLELDWDASAGATGYEYCIDDTLDSICDGDAWLSTGTLTTASPAGLAYLTTYQWQVRATNTNPNPTYANSGTWWIFTTVTSPPDPFDKISPEHNAPNQPSSQYLSWQPSNGATSYEYCLDIDPTPDAICDGTWVPTNLLYANAPGLTYGAVYEWQVRAVNASGTTYANIGDTPEWWTFTVEDEPAFSKANPNHEGINQPVDEVLRWTPESTALSYEYCIDSDLSTGHVGICDLADWLSTGAATFINLPTDLSHSTTYEWQVRAVISLSPLTYVYANAGETPEWWTFTTVEAPAMAFSKDSPSHNNPIVQPTIGLTLSWFASPTASGYRYCLDTSTNNTCDTSWLVVGSETTSVVVSNLEYNKDYQWQVLATNNNPEMIPANAGETPEWWTFTTAMASPEAFSKLGPANGAFDQLLDLGLSWEPTIGVTYFEYCLDSNLEAGHLGICDNTWISTGTGTTVNPAGLSYSTTYEWSVRAFSTNPYEPTLSDGGTWFVFTTVVAPPDVFTKNSPDSGLVDQPVNLMISWEASAGATGYEYCVDSDLTGPGCDGDWVETTSTQAIVTDLTNMTQYEWQVRAVNANPTIIESDGGWWTFSTIPLHSSLPFIMSPMLPRPVLNPVTIGPGVDNYILTWNAIAGATKYNIWESTSTTFPTDPKYVDITGTSYPLPSGVNPTRYYYYVVATSPSKSSPPSNTIAVDRQYELEDNNSSTTADGQIFPGVTYYYQLKDTKDYFKIYISGPGTINVALTSFPTMLWNGQLQLFDGDMIARAYDVHPEDGVMSLTFASPEAGWYYIYIASPSGYSSETWYGLITHFTPTP